MNKQPLISVIIPVYNLENYIEKCLDSVLSQTYKNLEILVVDDGSTDSSPSICDKYSQSDSRIQVFHIDNGGAAHARNTALEKMTGEFVTFVDGDDYIDSTYIEKLYNNITDKNADISICKWIDVYEDSFLSTVISHTYNDGKGVIKFDEENCSEEVEETLQAIADQREYEQEALAINALRVLLNEEEVKEYTGKPVWDGFKD